jgi:2,3-bisphosphoglycerate-independent phosphoglycerate mutase
MVNTGSRPRPLVLIVLDGWGHNPHEHCNAILGAKKPNWDRLWKEYPHTLIQGSGKHVGLPADQMGNSEVGHLNMGAGRVIYQEITRIDQAIETGQFAASEVLARTFDIALRNGSAMHVMGLLSEGGVHSRQAHIHAMLRLAASRLNPDRIYLHAFLDGRDTPPRSAAANIEAAERLFKEMGGGRIASLVGRYYAMDRDQRWDRTRLAYEMIAHGIAGYQARSAIEGLQAAYARGEGDEFVKPTLIAGEGQQPIRVRQGDVIVFMNFRADRARQLTRAFCERTFSGFDRPNPPELGAFVSLTEYGKGFDIPVVFPQKPIRNVLGEYLAQQGFTQLRIAETEKYAHVTFFFDGGEDRTFEGEEKILVPSPKVATYDLKPEMSAPELTDRLVAAIDGRRFDVIVCNYANADMVGHTGIYSAAVKAIEAVDACLGRVYSAVRRVGGEMIITADHGNAEQMCDETTGQPHTAHTSDPVPFIYVGRPASAAQGGSLSDIAPTMLYLMGLDRPAEMTGKPLVRLMTGDADRPAGA